MYDLPFNVEQKSRLRMCWELLSCSPVPRTTHVWAVEHRKAFCASRGVISVFPDFEQNCSWDVNKWNMLHTDGVISEIKDWQFSCSYRVWHRAPTHPAAFQQLVWKMMRRSVPTIPHTGSCWDCGPHSAARQWNYTRERVRKKKCLHF